MKLKTFNPDNARRLPRKMNKPGISISNKSGLVKINCAAIQLLDLKAGQQVLIHQDEKDEADWYMEIVSEGGFVLRRVKNNTAENLAFNSKVLCHAISESVAYEKPSGTIPVPKEPIEIKGRILWPLLTASLRN